MASALSWMWFLSAICSLIMNWNKQKIYIKEGVVSDRNVIIMDRFILNLWLGQSHQVSASSLNIFTVVSFKIGQFHNWNFSIESGEHGHQEVLLTFSVEVQIREQEDPCLSWGLSEHENIFGWGHESQEEKSCPEGQSVSSGKTEVLIVSWYLLWACYFVHCFEPFHGRRVDWVMLIVERMYVWFLSWSLNLYFGSGSGIGEESVVVGTLAVARAVAVAVVDAVAVAAVVGSVGSGGGGCGG